VSRRRLAAAALLAAVAVAIALVAAGGRDDRRAPLVVGVELRGATGASETATGFVAGPGRVITVAHVLDPGRRLLVRVRGIAHRARLVRADRRYDLALISVPGLGPSAGAQAGGGSRLLVRRAGHTEALAATLRRRLRATVRGPDWGPYRRPALELAARVQPGDSGAPFVDSRGRVAGVLFARASDGRPTAYALDAAVLTQFLSH
jgi:S1-C subfamily serine protease